MRVVEEIEGFLFMIVVFIICLIDWMVVVCSCVSYCFIKGLLFCWRYIC